MRINPAIVGESNPKWHGVDLLQIMNEAIPQTPLSTAATMPAREAATPGGEPASHPPAGQEGPFINKVAEREQEAVRIVNPFHKKQAPIPQEKAAQLCRVSVSTIERWDKGINIPPGYPGRGDLAVLATWGQQFRASKRLIKAGREAAKAKPGGDMSGFSEDWKDD